MRSSSVLPIRADNFTRSSFSLNFVNFHPLFMNNMYSVSWLAEEKTGLDKVKMQHLLISRKPWLEVNLRGAH